MLWSAAPRLLRKVLLHQGGRMDAGRMLERSRQGALRIAARAAATSVAYGSLLREQGIDPGSVNTAIDFKTLPVLTKTNTFGRFSLAELARPVPAGELADVLTSSGRGGRSFGFRLTTRKQHEASWFDIDLGLQNAFDVDRLPTLLVNCLPMGVVFRSRAVAVANVSVREDMACSILRDVGPRFAQTLLCSDPLFIRRLLHEATLAGIDWKALNTSVIMGEEVLVEAQRDYIAARMGIDIEHDPQRLILSSFGVGELGLNLLFETRETIRLRRAMRTNPAIRQLLAGREERPSLPSVFCFNPLRCHIEVLDPDQDGFGELCFTLLDPQAVIPLPRYTTGDLGKVLSPDEIARASGPAACSRPWLPVIAVRGRIKDHPSGMPSVEDVKELLYSIPRLADQLSGAFRMAKNEQGELAIVMQIRSPLLNVEPQLAEQFKAAAESVSTLPVAVDFITENPAAWGPCLDYERKFAYVAPAAS